MGVVRTKKTFGEFANIIEEAVDGIKRNVAQEIYNELIKKGTPYDTGTLVHSWRVSTATRGTDAKGVTQEGVIPEVFDHGGVYPSPIILNAKYKSSKRPFYVYNNQPYVTKLNDSQKWYKWIDGAVERAMNRVNNMPIKYA